MENFELEAKHRLEQYESPVDTAKMWAHIDAELRPAPKRRLGWLWLSLGVVGIAATWLIARQYQCPEQVFHAPQYIAPIENPPILSENVPQANDRQDQAIATASALSDAPLPTTTDTHNYTHTARVTQKGVSTFSTFVGTSIAGSNQVSEPLVTIAPRELSAPNLSEIVTRRESLLSITTGKLPSALDHKEEVPSLRGVSTPAATPDTDCYDWRPKPRLYGGIYGGASYPFKTLTARKKEDESYAELRKNTESVLESVQGGAFIGVMTPKKIFIEAGMEYNRINERFRTTTTTTDTIARYEVIGWVVNAQGDTTFVRDSVFVARTTTKGATIYNNFQFYNIPIAVGYEFGSAKSRLRPYVKGGLAINIAMPYKSGFLNTTGEIELYESSGNTTDTPYRTRINALPFLSVGARLRMQERLDVFGELNYRHHLNQVTLDSYILQQRYSLLGLNLGLSLRF